MSNSNDCLAFTTISGNGSAKGGHSTDVSGVAVPANLLCDSDRKKDSPGITDINLDLLSSKFLYSATIFTSDGDSDQDGTNNFLERGAAISAKADSHLDEDFGEFQIPVEDELSNVPDFPGDTYSGCTSSKNADRSGRSKNGSVDLAYKSENFNNYQADVDFEEFKGPGEAKATTLSSQNLLSFSPEKKISAEKSEKFIKYQADDDFEGFEGPAEAKAKCNTVATTLSGQDLLSFSPEKKISVENQSNPNDPPNVTIGLANSNENGDEDFGDFEVPTELNPKDNDYLDQKYLSSIRGHEHTGLGTTMNGKLPFKPKNSEENHPDEDFGVFCCNADDVFGEFEVSVKRNADATNIHHFVNTENTNLITESNYDDPFIGLGNTDVTVTNTHLSTNADETPIFQNTSTMVIEKNKEMLLEDILKTSESNPCSVENSKYSKKDNCDAVHYDTSDSRQFTNASHGNTEYFVAEKTASSLQDVNSGNFFAKIHISEQQTEKLNFLTDDVAGSSSGKNEAEIMNIADTEPVEAKCSAVAVKNNSNGFFDQLDSIPKDSIPKDKCDSYYIMDMQARATASENSYDMSTKKMCITGMEERVESMALPSGLSYDDPFEGLKIDNPPTTNPQLPFNVDETSIHQQSENNIINWLKNDETLNGEESITPEILNIAKNSHSRDIGDSDHTCNAIGTDLIENDGEKDFQQTLKLEHVYGEENSMNEFDAIPHPNSSSICNRNKYVNVIELGGSSNDNLETAADDLKQISIVGSNKSTFNLGNTNGSTKECAKGFKKVDNTVALTINQGSNLHSEKTPTGRQPTELKSALTKFQPEEKSDNIIHPNANLYKKKSVGGDGEQKPTLLVMKVESKGNDPHPINKTQCDEEEQIDDAACNSSIYVCHRNESVQECSEELENVNDIHSYQQHIQAENILIHQHSLDPILPSNEEYTMVTNTDINCIDVNVLSDKDPKQISLCEGSGDLNFVDDSNGADELFQYIEEKELEGAVLKDSRNCGFKDESPEKDFEGFADFHNVHGPLPNYNEDHNQIEESSACQITVKSEPTLIVSEEKSDTAVHLLSNSNTDTLLSLEEPAKNYLKTVDVLKEKMNFVASAEISGCRRENSCVTYQNKSEIFDATEELLDKVKESEDVNGSDTLVPMSRQTPCYMEEASTHHLAVELESSLLENELEGQPEHLDVGKNEQNETVIRSVGECEEKLLNNTDKSIDLDNFNDIDKTVILCEEQGPKVEKEKNIMDMKNTDEMSQDQDASWKFGVSNTQNIPMNNLQHSFHKENPTNLLSKQNKFCAGESKGEVFPSQIVHLGGNKKNDVLPNVAQHLNENVSVDDEMDTCSEHCKVDESQINDVENKIIDNKKSNIDDAEDFSDFGDFEDFEDVDEININNDANKNICLPVEQNPEVEKEDNVMDMKNADEMSQDGEDFGNFGASDTLSMPVNNHQHSCYKEIPKKTLSMQDKLTTEEPTDISSSHIFHLDRNEEKDVFLISAQNKDEYVSVEDDEMDDFSEQCKLNESQISDVEDNITDHKKSDIDYPEDFSDFGDFEDFNVIDTNNDANKSICLCVDQDPEVEKEKNKDMKNIEEVSQGDEDFGEFGALKTKNMPVNNQKHFFHKEIPDNSLSMQEKLTTGEPKQEGCSSQIANEEKDVFPKSAQNIDENVSVDDEVENFSEHCKLDENQTNDVEDNITDHKKSNADDAEDFSNFGDFEDFDDFDANSSNSIPHIDDPPKCAKSENSTSTSPVENLNHDETSKDRNIGDDLDFDKNELDNFSEFDNAQAADPKSLVTKITSSPAKSNVNTNNDLALMFQNIFYLPSASIQPLSKDIGRNTKQTSLKEFLKPEPEGIETFWSSTELHKTFEAVTVLCSGNCTFTDEEENPRLCNFTNRVTGKTDI